MGSNKIEDSYSLSPIQEGMLFHSLYSPKSGVDIEQIICTIREDFVVKAFKKAGQRVLERHPVLRTGFRWQGVDEPIQEVHRNITLPFDQHDWRGHNMNDQDTALEKFLQTDRKTGFNLTDPPLMRITLIRSTDIDYHFIWTFHHILLDGRSFPIVLKELFDFYEAFCRGDDLQIEQPRPYRDYIDWRGKQEFEKGENFWREALNGFTVPTPLVIERVQYDSSKKEDGNGFRMIRLSKELTSSLLSLAKKNQLTLNNLVQGAWALLLSRYSGEEDIVFGATRACRRSTIDGAESMVGSFINTLPIRIRVSPGRSLLSLLKELRKQWLSFRDYEHTPLVKIQEWSDILPGKSLFESILVFENSELNSALRNQGERWNNMELKLLEQPNYPLVLSGYAESELLLIISYEHQRFESDAIVRMLGHLRTLLEAMVSNPEQNTSELQILTDQELNKVLVEWNDTSKNYQNNKCIHQMFEIQVEKTPEAVAVVYENQILTFRDLNERSNQLAHYLIKNGVGPEVLVGLCMDRSIEIIIGILGILKAGGAYVPMDPSYPKERLAYMLKDTGTQVLLTRETLIETLPSHDACIVCLDKDWSDISKEISINPEINTKQDNLAYVIYTSGTTGIPKGVLIQHKNVSRLFEATHLWFKFSKRDVWTLFHSYTFDFSVWELWGALFYGGRLVIVPDWVSRSPEAFYELVCREHVTVLNQTPSVFYHLDLIDKRMGNARALSLRLIIFGGEALDLNRLESWFDRHGDESPQLVNMYGITETTVHVTYRPLKVADIHNKSGSVIGCPIPDLQVYILDKNKQLVPIGVSGEIYVGGAGLARGYLDQPELTREKFSLNLFSKNSNERLYKSGDMARYLPNGDIEYLGRIDHQVKIRGFRIELGEIEVVLDRHLGVKHVVVLAREDEPDNKRLVAYILSENDFKPSTSELRNFLKEKLPEYMVPSAFVMLKELPLTPNGKIDRKALPAPDQERPELEKEFVAPCTSVEKELAKIWCEVLKLKQIGVNDNFFELGGHSLLVTQLIWRIKDALQVELPLRLVFDSPLIAEIAQKIEKIKVNVEEDKELGRLLDEMEGLSDEEAQRLLKED